MKAEYLLTRLFEVGHEMRCAQRDYFRTKSKDALEKSKKLEKQFDNVLFNIKQLKDANSIES